MCSRFELNADAREVAARFGLSVPPLLPNRAEIRPTDLALVIGPEGARLLCWGLEVSWDRRPLINARAETLTSKPTFRPLLRSRVLIPVTGWWEWTERKVKMRITPAAGGLVALAGLAEGERFTLVTTAAVGPLAEIHDRMPAVLRGEAEKRWVDAKVTFGDLWSCDTGFKVAEDPSGQPDLFG